MWAVGLLVTGLVAGGIAYWNHQSDQRAWVDVTAINDVHMPASPEDLTKALHQGFVDLPYSYDFSNRGKTPAHVRRVASRYSFGSDPIRVTAEPAPSYEEVIPAESKPMR